MIPKRLLISGFLSYKETVEIDFEKFDIACISGLNGAGKSSLLDALTWCIFGIARRKDDAIINHKSDLAEVEFDFDYENATYRIIRKKQRNGKPILEFFIFDGNSNWKPLTERTIRDTEEFIGKTLRLDYETFVNASFFLQGKADQFAQQRPGDRKRILSSILGLEKWEIYRQRVIEKRKIFEKTLAGLLGQIEEIDNELALETDRKTRLKKLTEDLENIKKIVAAEEKNLENARLLAASLNEQSQYLGVLKSQYESIKNRIEEQNKQLESRKAEWNELNNSISKSEDIVSAYQEWQVDINKLEQLNELAEKFYQLDSLKNKLTNKIDNQRSLLEQERESLLLQSENIKKEKSSLISLNNKISEYQIQIENNNDVIDKISTLEIDIREIDNNIVKLKSENDILFDSMQKLQERIDKLSNSEKGECPLCGQQLLKNDRESLNLNLREEGKRQGDTYREKLAQIKEFSGSLEKYKKELGILNNKREELLLSERQLDQALLKKEHIVALLSEWDAKGKNRLDELNDLLSNDNYLVEDKKSLVKVKADIIELGYDVQIHKLAKEKELDGRNSESLLRKLESAKATLEPLSREIKELEKKIAEDQSGLVDQEETYKNAEQRYKELNNSLPDIKNIESQLIENKDLANQLRLQVGGATQAVEVLAQLRQRRKKINDEREDLQEKISQLKILDRAFSKDGIPALLIEQALPEIEIQANEILSSLSNGEMSVQFETQREYKDKKRQDKKETLDILISDSSGERAYEMFSGGEAFRINFAIRLALSRVLAHRAGARLQTLVIDEGFGSQDAGGRQRIIEAINLVREDFEKILVITHLEDLKDVFPARLEVEKKLSGSCVSLVI